MKSLVSINDIDKTTILKICQRALEIKTHGFSKTLPDKIIATLFFEPSTRTKLSFQSAILRSGAQILNFEADNSSLKKGETLEDTIRMTSAYADLIVIRHPEAGSALRAQQVSSCPIINAGDGTNEHPTQTLLDLVTILEHHGSLDGFTITLGGDLKYSRTIPSLLHALAHFDVKIILASPQLLALPDHLKAKFQDKIILQTNSLKEGLKSDYFYMTRVQKERITGTTDITFEEDWILNKNLCEQYANKNTKILHPLPRVNEITTDIDDSPYQLYFTQAENGVYTRIALLEYILGVY